MNMITKKLVFILSAVFVVSISVYYLAQAGDMDMRNQEMRNQDTDMQKQDMKDQDRSRMREHQPDQQITQKIRQALSKDKSLSNYGTNLSISTVDGMVTLKGSVKNEEDKKAIEEKAADIAGKDNVKNEIKVAP